MDEQLGQINYTIDCPENRLFCVVTNSFCTQIQFFQRDVAKAEHQTNQLSEELRHAFRKHQDDDTQKKALESDVRGAAQREQEKLQEIKVFGIQHNPALTQTVNSITD